MFVKIYKALSSTGCSEQASATRLVCWISINLFGNSVNHKKQHHNF